MSVASRPLGDFLVGRGVISPEQLSWALAREASDGQPLAAVLLASELATERDVLAGAAEQLGIPYADLRHRPASPSMAAWLPEAAARRVGAVPLEHDGTTLVVALADPTDERTVRWLAQQAGCPVRAALASPTDVEQALDGLYPPAPPAASGASPAPRDLDGLLARLVQVGGSDLHLSAGLAPGLRVNGEISRLEELGPVDGEAIARMVDGILSAAQKDRFAEDLELDTSYTVGGVGRFRVNVFLQRGSMGAVFRAIPFEVPPFERLGLPDAVASIATLGRGLVLVTGPTGSGKSTTLASLIDIINATRAAHIMTVEDPIEFLHSPKRCIVNQREVGLDTLSFANALKHALRQDPDVILVGEMRDLETISTALTAAETGHLVFGTLHTQSAPQSVDRIIDVFPAHQQQQVRTQLATALQAVVTQQLIPAAAGGRAVAAEVMMATPAIRNLVREGKIHQIPSAMQSGAQGGMQTMDQSLVRLVRAGTVALDVALEHSHSPEDLRRLLNAN